MPKKKKKRGKKWGKENKKGKKNKRQKRQEPGWILWTDRSKINYRNKMVACTNGWKLLKRNAE